MIDQQRLTQILVNLLSNSLKFTSEGFIHINCKIVEKNVKIIIKDSGIGISEED